MRRTPATTAARISALIAALSRKVTCCDHGSPTRTLSPAVSAASSSHSGGTVKTRTVLIPASRHQREIALDDRGLGKRRAVAAGGKRAVGDALDEMLAARRRRRICRGRGSATGGAGLAGRHSRAGSVAIPAVSTIVILRLATAVALARRRSLPCRSIPAIGSAPRQFAAAAGSHVRAPPVPGEGGAHDRLEVGAARPPAEQLGRASAGSATSAGGSPGRRGACAPRHRPAADRARRRRSPRAPNGRCRCRG